MGTVGRAESPPAGDGVLPQFCAQRRGETPTSPPPTPPPHPQVRAEINELITQLEARNPAPSLVDDPTALDGVWRLTYTNALDLLPLLALGKLPGVTVGDVTQTIAAGTAVNEVALAGPLASTTLRARADVGVRSATRVAVTFTRGEVATPSLVDTDGLPDSVTVMGMAVDLSGVKAALAPAAAAARAAAVRVASALPARDLSIPLPSSEKATTWLINTYIDSDTRVARGDGGGVFVMVRDPPTAAEVEVAEEETRAQAAMVEVAVEALEDE